MNQIKNNTDVLSRKHRRAVKRAGALITAAAGLVVLMMTNTAAGQELGATPSPKTPSGVTPSPTTPSGVTPSPSVGGQAPAAGTPAPGSAPVLPPSNDGEVISPATDATPGQAAKGSIVADGLDPSGSIVLTVGKSRVVTTHEKYARISTGHEETIAVNLTGPSSFMITAKKPGNTGVIIWDDAGHTTVVDVSVEPDLAVLRQQIKESFPGTNVLVTALTADQLTLRGTVPSLKTAEQIVELASAFGKIHNFMEVSGCQQVMLQVRFAEVSKSATQELGINFGGVDGTSSFGNNVGQVSPLGFIQGANNTLSLGVPSPSGGVTLFGSGAVGRTSFAYFLQALEENGLVRMLAEPNVMAVSGQPAEFTAGGEFPVPVSQGGGSGSGAAVTVDYKEYGVKLNFTPVVLGDGSIRLRVNPEVSELDFANAVRSNGFLIPALTTRKLETTVELGDGQTLALAGLLNQTMSDTTDAVPLLGDIPILGVLFRSTKYQRSETELVVLVTPRLVAPMNPGQVPTLPGEHWRHPNEAAEFFLSDMGGPINDPTGKSDKGTGKAPQFHGNYGFSAAGAGTVQPASK
jgi:pilus assembly protein CpaC